MPKKRTGVPIIEASLERSSEPEGKKAPVGRGLEMIGMVGRSDFHDPIVRIGVAAVLNACQGFKEFQG